MSEQCGLVDLTEGGKWVQCDRQGHAKPMKAPQERIGGKLYRCKRCQDVKCHEHCPPYDTQGLCISCYGGEEDIRVLPRRR